MVILDSDAHCRVLSADHVCCLTFGACGHCRSVAHFGLAMPDAEFASAPHFLVLLAVHKPIQVLEGRQNGHP